MSLLPSLDDIDALATIYPHSPEHLHIIRPQIEQRSQLVKTWGIRPGERVLEIGCGQGDCTLVLAAAVGEKGSVTAIDPASLDYGSPFTLGQAQAHLRASSLGSRMTFVQADPIEFLRTTTERYTTAVMAQCIWYFAHPQVFTDIMAALQSRVDRVCISEYSLIASDYRAFPHVLAAFAQASLECRKETSESNVRTVMSPERLKESIKAAGLTVREESIMRVPDGMLDGTWEVSWVLSSAFLREIEGAVKDEREKSVVLAARDSVLGAKRVLEERGEKVRTMDVWVATVTSE
ncbi:S-adenosyl-L-methionine-dependent methyltransferase [Cubamyces lactineus]|nr:S-adenosyl-L-methionine-dependent methyltransferase [Cubamyces lactineus]